MIRNFKTVLKNLVELRGNQQDKETQTTAWISSI